MRPATERSGPPAHDPAATTVPLHPMGSGSHHLRHMGLLLAALAVGACGGEPPEELGGFRLDMTQAQVMDLAYDRQGFVCRLVASRPKQTVCSGPSELGRLEAAVVGDSGTVRITVEIGRETEDPAAAVRDFVDPFGEPAWRDRPYPPTADPPEGYHTLWLDADSTRAVAMICRGEALGPPCNARLMTTTPAGIRAKLDSLLNIR